MATRIYRTRTGRHVLEDDPEAAFLAYSQYDDVPPAVLEEVGLKQAAKPADKQAAKPEDKSVEKPRRGRPPGSRNRK